MRIPTPRLPIAIPANATLTLTRELGSYITDDRTGNEIPEIESIEVSASLTKDLYQNRLAEGVGSDLQSIYLIGYILDPPDDISDFELDGIATMTLADFATGNTLLGEFEFHYVPTPFGATLAAIGIPIRGIYRVVENVEVGAKRLAGVIESIGSFTATITLTKTQRMSGAIESSGTYTATVRVEKFIVGAIESTGSLSGSASIGKTLAGIIESSGSNEASLTTSKALSGVIDSVGAVNGDAVIAKRLAGTIAAVGTLTVAPSIRKRLTGTIAATGATTATLTTSLLGRDTFTTGSAGTAISARSPEFGAWTTLVGTSGGSIVLTDAGRARLQKVGTGFESQTYAIADSPTRRHTVAATIFFPASVSNYSAGVITCASSSLNAYYAVIYARLAGEFRLIKRLTTGTTVLGSISSPLVAGSSANIEIEFANNPRQIIGRLNGTVFATSSDTDLSPAAQFLGIIATADSGAVSSNTLGLHIDNVEARLATVALEGTAQAIASIAGRVSLTQRLSGTIATDADITGDISVGDGLKGAVNAIASLSGTVSTSKRLSETIDASAVIDGSIVVEKRLSGIIEATGSEAGDLLIIKSLAGVIGSNGAIAGTITTVKRISGTIATVGEVSGDLTIVSITALAGTIEAFADYDGDLLTEKTLTGTIVTTATNTGTISIDKLIAGTIASTGTYTASLNAIKKLSGAINATGVCEGDLTTVDILKGTILASGSYAGSLTTTKKLSGTIASSGTIAGSAALEKSLIGTVNTTGTYAGNLTVEGGAVEPSLDFSDTNNSMYIPLL